MSTFCKFQQHCFGVVLVLLLLLLWCVLWCCCGVVVVLLWCVLWCVLCVFKIVGGYFQDFWAYPPPPPSQAAGVSQNDTNRNPHFGWAMALNRGHNSTRTPPTPEREERMKFPAGERKKSAKFWAPPPFGPPPFGPPPFVPHFFWVRAPTPPGPHSSGPRPLLGPTPPGTHPSGPYDSGRGLITGVGEAYDSGLGADYSGRRSS